MRSLYFSKSDQPGRNFWRCGLCRQDFSCQLESGTLVQVGSDCTAISCHGCLVKVRELVANVVPHSFPDLDNSGALL